VRGFEYGAHGITDFRFVAAPQIPRRRVAARSANRFDHGGGRLNALRFLKLKLAQLVLRGQQDHSVGVDTIHALDVAVIAQQRRALVPRERIIADDFRRCALARIALSQSGPLRRGESLGRLHAHGVHVVAVQKIRLWRLGLAEAGVP
jgi:hypothetical protein